MNKPTDAELKKAIDLHKAGRAAEAETLYRAFLGAQPRHGEANHNLGALLAQRGEMQQSLPFFKTALETDSSVAQYWLSYARALHAAERSLEAQTLLLQGGRQGLSGPACDLLMAKILMAMGKFDDAAEALQNAAALQPENADLFFNLGNSRAVQGNFHDAVAAYRRAIAIKPDFAEVHFRLGSVLSENGHVAEGFAYYMRRAALVYGGDKPPVPTRPEPEHKLKHDREQREYLAGGKIDSDAPGVPFHLEPGERVTGHAVNPATVTPALLNQWRTSRPQLVVIDDFLSTEALDNLRRYCAGSTIWRRIYDAGYIGATPEDGFACPLLAQIVEELPVTFPDILGPHHFHYLGAFKYDSALSSGTNTHADNSAVNVNFYIAPDEANLDPQSGGMDIWDVTVPPGEDMRLYNRDEALTRDLLHRSNARLTRIAHRANRAVIFRSDHFHKTSDCHFREGYLNKRINVSLLFGRHRALTS